MILHSYDRTGNGRLLVYVLTGGTITNEPDTLAIYTIDGPVHSNVDLVAQEPKVNHKKKLREFTNQLNERDRKRRWRK